MPSLVSSSDLARAQNLVGTFSSVERRVARIPPTSRFEFLIGPVLRQLKQLGCSNEQLRSLRVRIIVVACAALTLTAIWNNFLCLLLVPMLLLLEYLALLRAHSRRRKEFLRDYPVFLLSLGSAIRVGIDSLQAVMQSAAFFPLDNEIRKEILRLKERLEEGEQEEKALWRFGASIAPPEIKLFQMALILSRREGAPITNSLQRLAKVSRQRESFRRKTRAALALQKLSGLGIAGCAVAILLIQAVVNRETFVMALEHPIASQVLCLSAFLVLSGLVWIISLGGRYGR